MRSSTLMATTCLATVLTTAPVCAQPASLQADGAAATNVSSVPPSATAERAAQSNPDEIIVTARRREESLLDVPVSVNAFSAEALASKGLVRVDDLQVATPSLRFTPASGRRSDSVVEIRGIGVDESLITQDPAVGVYVNEVYRARPYGVNQAFYDMDNVQVLYGPQGTLFGRNATSGAILINTKKPTQNFGGQIEAGYGNLDRYQITGILNVPVSSTLAIRLAGQYLKSDGYARDVTNNASLGGVKEYSGRASILWTPNDQIESLSVGSLIRVRNEATPVSLFATVPCNPVSGLPFPTNYFAGSPSIVCLYSPQVNAALGTGDITAADRSNPYVVGYDKGKAVFERLNAEAVSNTTTIRLSDTISIKNVFGYSQSKILTGTDLDATPVSIIYVDLKSKNKQISNELQIQGDDGRLNWTAGGLIFRERGRDLQFSDSLTAFNPNVPLLLNGVGINKSYAVFAQATYKLTDQLSLTAGGRYSWDERTAIYDNSRNRVGQPGGERCVFDTAIYPSCYIELKKNFSKPTYTFSIDYKPDTDTLIYATTRQGYRAGGFNARAQEPSQFTPFEPETVRDAEVGLKGSRAISGDIHVRTSISAYYTWYNNIQRSKAVPGVGGVPATIIANAASARIKGFEANFGVTLVRGLDISGYWGYVDGKYKKFDTGGIVYRNVDFPAAKNTVGATIVMTPIDAPESGTVRMTANYSYRSSYYGNQSAPLLLATERVRPQQMLNLNLSWDSIAGGPVSAEAWVRNATDERTVLGILGLSSALGFSTEYFGPPRTYGLTLKYRFGEN